MELPRLPDVQARFAAPDDLAPIEQVPLDSPDPGPMASLVLDYLAGLDRPAATLSELLQSINAEDEEDLSAIRCAEGVAVTSASDGWWVLFTEPGRG